MAYNYLTDIENIYNAKVGYNKATTDEERKRQNEIATAARKNLEAYGYGDIAQQLSATGADATAARKILEQYKAPKTTTTTTPTATDTNTKYSSNTLKTGVDNDAYNNRVSSAASKNDIYFNTVQNDHTNVNKKYNSLYNYANSDITQTDEYKSAFNNIMPSYTLAAMQGRENELASGSASNGGNIDSFAAANAFRQQTAITAKGQALAHQMGLEAANSRVNNVNNILSNLGVYNSSVYSAMSDSINNDRNMFNDITNNEQTALNNETARLSEQASVTGYVPNEWVVSNNPYLDDNGKLKDEYKNVDFSAVMADAKAKGNTEVYNAAATARFYKIMGDYATYGQWDDGNYALPGSQRTAEYDLTQQQIASAEKIAKGENDTKLAITDKESALAQQQINASLEAARLENEKDAYAGYNVLLSMWPANEVEKRAFIEKFIKPLYESGTAVPPESLKQLIVANSTAYNIDVDDATKICQAYGVSTDWLSGYRDRTKDDGMVTWYDGTSHEGQYGGMVKK